MGMSRASLPQLSAKTYAQQCCVNRTQPFYPPAGKTTSPKLRFLEDHAIRRDSLRLSVWEKDEARNNFFTKKT
jgi:ethanolamine ammonia-lyase small subunit